MRLTSTASPRSFAAAAVPVLALCLGQQDLRRTLLLLVASVVCLRVPVVARLPLALVVGAGVGGGALPTVLSAAAALAAGGCWPRDRSSLVRAGILGGTLLLVRLATGRNEAAGQALCLLVVLLAPLEDGLPRTALATGLVLVALPGCLALGAAWRARTDAEHAPTLAHVMDAAARCDAIGWRGCAESMRVHQAEQERTERGAATAEQTLRSIRDPSPSTVLSWADAALALPSQAPAARLALAELAGQSPEARAPLSPLGNLTWAHALARAGHRDRALEILSASDDPFRTLLQKPAPTPPGFHALADAVSVSFPASPSGCVRRGEVPPLTFTWHVEDGFAPGEGFVCFVHADGPRTLGFDHLIGGRQSATFTHGETIADPLGTPVPLDAPAGRYVMHVGVYAPDSGVRLQPRGLPSHISYLDGPTFEVCR